MPTIAIRSNIASVTAALDAAGRRQIPFAASLALTNVAKNAQAKLRADLPKEFTIRNGWVSKGIQVQAAKKKSWPVFAVVGDKYPFMVRQSEGGSKTAANGGALGIPIMARPTATDITPKRLWPGQLLKRKRERYFVMKVKTGKLAGKMAVFRRTGPGKAGLSLYYILQPTVEVKAHWPFHQTVEKVATATYDKEFGKALAFALATAR